MTFSRPREWSHSWSGLMQKTVPSGVPPGTQSLALWKKQSPLWVLALLPTSLFCPGLGECVPGEQEPEPSPLTVSTFSHPIPTLPAWFLLPLLRSPCGGGWGHWERLREGSGRHGVLKSEPSPRPPQGSISDLPSGPVAALSRPHFSSSVKWGSYTYLPWARIQWHIGKILSIVPKASEILNNEMMIPNT